MKNTALLLLLSLIMGSNSFSQYFTNSVSHKYPDDHIRTMLYFNLAHAETSLSPNLGFGGRFETQLYKFTPWINYYLDYSSNDDKNGIQAINGIKKKQIIEFGSNFILRKKTEQNKNIEEFFIKVRYPDADSISIIEWSIEVPFKTFSYFNLRGGYSIYRSLLDLELGLDSLGNRISEQPYYYFESDDGSLNIELEPITQTHTGVLFLGLNYRTILEYSYHIQSRITGSHPTHYDRTIERNSKFRGNFDIYFDLIYAPFIKIDNFYDSRGTEWRVVAEDRVEPKKWGWRAGGGFFMRSFFVKGELGWMPGPFMVNEDFVDNFYVSAVCGIFIGTNKGIFVLD